MKKILCMLLALAMLAVSLAACSDSEGEDKEEVKYKSDDIVVSSENFSYTRAEFSIAFNQFCNEFFYDSEVVDFYNVDPSVSLKDQVYYDDVTWFDYFADMAVDYMERVLVLCEAAKAEGMSLSEKDLESVEEGVDHYVRYAADYGYTEEEYFELRFGADTDQDCLREYFKKEALAYMYEDSVLKEYSFDEEEMKTLVEENREKFYTIDYVSYMFDEDDDINAKTAAEGLAAITDRADFEQYILDYMETTLKLPTDDVTLEGSEYRYKYYDEYSEFSKWAFGDEAKAGATYVRSNEVDGQYTVYLLLSVPTLRTEPTKDIRFLRVDMDKYDTSAIAKSHADSLLEAWESGERTEESFIELLKKESDDDASKVSGGLISKVAYGDEIPEGLDRWLYDSETQANSAKVFKDAGCYYIIYFCGDNEPKWKVDAFNWLENENYTGLQEDLIDQYPVEKFTEVIESLDE